MPDPPELQAYFGRPRRQKPGRLAAARCGFAVAHLLALFSAQTGVLHEALALPFQSAERDSST